jgi:hypothetical protein
MRFALWMLLVLVGLLAFPTLASASGACVSSPWATSEAAEAGCDAAEPDCSVPDLTDAERGPVGPRCLQPGPECWPDERTTTGATPGFDCPLGREARLPHRGVGLLPGAAPTERLATPIERASPPASPPPRRA